MKLVSSFPSGRDETDRFQHVEMLRYCLAGESQPVLHRQTRAQLEQRLAVPLVQLVENCAVPGPRVLRTDRPCKNNRQVVTCLSSRADGSGTKRADRRE